MGQFLTLYADSVVLMVNIICGIFLLSGHDLLVKHASVQGWYSLRIATIRDIVAFHVLLHIRHDLIYEEVLALILRLLGLIERHLFAAKHFIVRIIRPKFCIVGRILPLIPRNLIQNGQITRIQDPHPLLIIKALLDCFHQL